MKRLLFLGLVALGLAMTAAPVRADGIFEYSNYRHLTWIINRKQRCFNYSSHIAPLPGVSNCASGYCATPTPWNALPAYAPHPPAYPAPVAAAPAAPAPAAPAPAAPTPSFKAPQPAPAATNPTGLQRAGYSYYGQTNNAVYSPNAAYNYGASYYGAGYGYGYYGYGANYSYAQAPNYWY